MEIKKSRKADLEGGKGLSILMKGVENGGKMNVEI